MGNLHWEIELRALYEKAVTRCRHGQTRIEDFFNSDELVFLRSIGHTTREVFDFADDKVNYGEPDWETFLLIAAVRRDYFQVEQNGTPSEHIVASETLPSKEADADGILWLPRVLGKAKAKLRGEMNPDMMYGCGGDREFFQKNNVHPADFLRHVWAADGDDRKVIDYVKACCGKGV